jgi:hypothetical protein
MFQTFKHLLPRALAWRTTIDTTLRRYLEGLAAFALEVRTFIDLVYLDLFPPTTRELAAWEKQFALSSGGPELDRRSKLEGAWKLNGGQSPDYLQRALHEAGFTSVFVYDWWFYDPPGVRNTRDPRDFVTQPLIGFYQCEVSNQWECWDPPPGQPLGAHCDGTLINSMSYLVNLDLTRRAPPPVPDDPDSWPYFMYLAGETFDDVASVPSSRLAELRELILRLRPAHLWIVMRVEGVDELEGFGAAEFGSAPMGA